MGQGHVARTAKRWSQKIKVKLRLLGVEPGNQSEGQKLDTRKGLPNIEMHSNLLSCAAPAIMVYHSRAFLDDLRRLMRDVMRLLSCS